MATHTTPMIPVAAPVMNKAIAPSAIKVACRISLTWMLAVRDVHGGGTAGRPVSGIPGCAGRDGMSFTRCSLAGQGLNAAFFYLLRRGREALRHLGHPAE